MKLPNFIRKRKKMAAFVAGAVIIIGGGSGGLIVIHSGGGGCTFNITADYYLCSSGSDTNSGTSTSSPLLTPQAACNKAVVAGGARTVSIAPGSYTIGFNLTNCAPTSLLTFATTPGVVTNFEGNSTFGPNIHNITLQGSTIGPNNVGFSLGKVILTGNTAPNDNTNLTWNNINLYCKVGSAPWVQIHSNLTNEDACSSEISITGNTVGFTWDGGDQSNWASCLTSCTNQNNGGINPNDDQLLGSTPQNITIKNVTFSYFFSLDNNGSAGNHSEIWKIDQGNSILFQNDKFIACMPPPSTGYAVNNSCNSGFIFFGQNGTNNTADNISFIQNIISPGENICVGCTSQVALSFSYDVPAGNENHLTFLYNTLDGGMTTCGTSTNNKCGPGTGSTYTGVNTTWVGNIAIYTSFGNCYPSGIYRNNVWWTNTANTAAKCSSTTDHAFTNTTAATLWLSPNSPNFNYTPQPIIQGFGENTYCATLPSGADINGRVRPTSTPCDPGAIQH